MLGQREVIKWTCQGRALNKPNGICGWENKSSNKRFVGQETKSGLRCGWCGCTKYASDLRQYQINLPLEGSFEKRYDW